MKLGLSMQSVQCRGYRYTVYDHYCTLTSLHCSFPAKQTVSILCCSMSHRRRSSVNFKGAPNFCLKICLKNQQNARILHDSCPKNYQNTRIFMIFARKIYKIPEFYMIFARILRNNCPKNIFARILGGHVPPTAPRLLCLWYVCVFVGLRSLCICWACHPYH